jgi:hypothetical protein
MSICGVGALERLSVCGARIAAGGRSWLAQRFSSAVPCLFSSAASAPEGFLFP